LVALDKRVLDAIEENEGTAIDSRIADTANTTINSSSVVPDCFIASPDHE
jgi:hypothetical protein